MKQDGHRSPLHPEHCPLQASPAGLWTFSIHLPVRKGSRGSIWGGLSFAPWPRHLSAADLQGMELASARVAVQAADLGNPRISPERDADHPAAAARKLGGYGGLTDLKMALDPQ